MNDSFQRTSRALTKNILHKASTPWGDGVGKNIHARNIFLFCVFGNDFFPSSERISRLGYGGWKGSRIRNLVGVGNSSATRLLPVTLLLRATGLVWCKSDPNSEFLPTFRPTSTSSASPHTGTLTGFASPSALRQGFTRVNETDAMSPCPPNAQDR